MKIKLCGITTAGEVAFLNETLPDYAGFVFAPSKRRITYETAAGLKSLISNEITIAGVFVNEPLQSLLSYRDVIGVIQLHGGEDGAYIRAVRELMPEKEIWKAVKADTAEEIISAQKLDADMLLLDSGGGTGIRFDVNAVRGAKINKPYFLAGGLTPENVTSAISEITDALNGITPYGVDVSGGIETNGVKDLYKIKRFIQNVNY